MRILIVTLIFIHVFSSITGIFDTSVSAMSVEELQREIELKRIEKEKIDAENRKLEAQIQQVNTQAKSLQNEVKTLDTTQKKLQNDLRITETNISRTELSIEKAGMEILTSEQIIEQNKKALAESIRTIAQADSMSAIELFLKNKSLSATWDELDSLEQFQVSIRAKTEELVRVKEKLVVQKKDSEEKKNELLGLKVDLADRKTVVEQNKQTKATLLTQTQNKESEYKKLLAENIERGKKFEQELFNYEAQLKIAIDRSKLPSERSGVLQWPLDNVTITQRFGRTVDSRRLYTSGTHNGVDFRASVGTQVKTILSGVVQATGNTDDQKGCFSYGRWILIKHPNGLTSLYAHLSSSRVKAGDTVETGQVIGLSGGQPGSPGAGYSTGPHLHLGVFASEGVVVQKYGSSRFCQQVSIPIASTDAYLDPLAYLPPIN